MTDRDRDAAAPAAARLLDAAAAAEAAARLRVDAAAADLALPGAARLSDYQRAAVTRMATRIVATLEAALVAGVAPALDRRPAAPLAPRLARAGVLHDAELIALLLRRAAAHRLAVRLWREDGASPLAALADDPAGDVAAAAHALLAAERGGYDAFQDAALDVADLPAELQHRLIWAAAAALRADLLAQDATDVGAVDRAIAAAATGLLARCDEDEATDARAAALARALAAAGRLDDAAVVGLGEAGHVAAAVALLAARAQIAAAGAWEMALDPSGARLALLLRCAVVGEAAAARLLAAWLNDADAAARLAAAAARIAPEAARAATALWRLDAGYRAAILAQAPR